MWKNGKIFENLGKTIQNWKYEKGQVIVCDYCMQYTARKGPGRYLFAGLLPQKMWKVLSTSWWTGVTNQSAEMINST